MQAEYTMSRLHLFSHLSLSLFILSLSSLLVMVATSQVLTAWIFISLLIIAGIAFLSYEFALPLLSASRKQRHELSRLLYQTGHGIEFEDNIVRLRNRHNGQVIVEQAIVE
jgi:hypothetical protein